MPIARLLVCGSRSWTDADLIEEEMVPLEPEVVMQGEAEGADRLAKRIAKKWGFKVESYPADWKRWDKVAGVVRNWDMLRAEPDMVLAFWDGKSAGTAHMVSIAQHAKIPTKIVLPRG